MCYSHHCFIFATILFFASNHIKSTNAQSTNVGCDGQAICPLQFKGWYEPGEYYHYNFKIVQNVTIVSADRTQMDHQTATTSGEYVLRRRSNGCALDIAILKSSISVPIEGDMAEEISIDLSTPFTIVVDAEDKFSICIADDELWKNNIRRSLASMILQNFDSISSSPDLDFISKPTNETFRKCSVEYESSVFSNMQKVEHVIQPYGFAKAAECYEEKVVGAFQIIVNTTTSYIITLADEKLKSVPKSVNANNTLKSLSMKFDFNIMEPTQDGTLQLQFSKSMDDLCKIASNGRLASKFIFENRELTRIMPHAKLQDEWVKVISDCGDGKSPEIYKQLLAASPSEDTIEMMKDMIISGNLSESAYRAFVWSSIQLPTLSPYIGIRGLRALKEIVAHYKGELPFEVDADEFSLSMLSVMTKLKHTGNTEIIKQEIRDFVMELDKIAGNHQLSRNAELEVLRMKNVVYSDDEHACHLAGSNDFETLKCINPCTSKVERYFRSLLHDQEKSEDIKIAAYLYMRKCQNGSKWMWENLVGEYLSSPTVNEEVKRFILIHNSTVNKVLSENDLEWSKYGRTFYYSKPFKSLYSISNEYENFINVEINLVSGKDSLPRLLTLDITLDSLYDARRFFKIEILRTESNYNDPNRLDVFITFRESDVTTFSSTVPLNLEKIRNVLRSISNQTSTARSAILKEWANMIKSKYHHLVRKLFPEGKLNILKSKIFQDKTTKFPTISGLPMKTEILSAAILSFDYNWDVKWINGEYAFAFQFSPSVNWKITESAFLEFGYSKILGYKIATKQNFGAHFAIDLNTMNDQRTFLIKLKFFPDDSNSNLTNSDNTSFYHEFQYMRVSRYRFFNGSSWDSDHIYKGNEAVSNWEAHLEKYFSLLNGGLCKSEIASLSKPESDSRISSCRIPNINIQIQLLLGNFTSASLLLEAFPDNATVYNSYLAKLGFQRKVKCSKVKLILEFKTPRMNSTFYGTTINNQREKELKLGLLLGNADYGIKLYAKQSPFDGLHDLGIPSCMEDTWRNKTFTLSSNPPLLQKQVEFGISKWANGKTSTVSAGLAFKQQKILYSQISFDGIGRILNGNLSLLLATNSNATKTLLLDENEEFPVTGEESSISITLRTERLGKLSFESGCFRANDVFEVNVDSSSPHYYLNAHTGWIYLNAWDDVQKYQLIEADYVHFLRSYNILNTDWGRQLKSRTFGKMSSLPFPFLNTIVDTSENQQWYPTFQSYKDDFCDEETNGTKTMEIIFSNNKFSFLLENGIQKVKNASFARKCEVVVTRYTQLHLGSFLYLKDRRRNERFALTDQENMEFGVSKSNSTIQVQRKADYSSSNKLITWEVSVHTSNGTEHKTKHVFHENGASVIYNGSYTRELLGPRFTLNGVYNITDALGNQFVGELNEEGWTEPVMITFKETKAGLNVIYTLNASDSENAYVDAKLELDYEAQTKLVASTFVKNLITFTLLWDQELIGKLEIIPLDWSIKTNWKLLPNSFVGTLTSHSIENPKQRLVLFESKNEIHVTNVSASVENLSRIFRIVPCLDSNYKISSKTKIRVLTFGQKITFIGQLYPEESQASPILHLEWILPTADRILVELKNQFRLPDSNESNPDIAIGSWTVLEIPGYLPFTTSTTFNGHGFTKNNSEITTVQYDFAIEHIFRHRQLLFSLLDTEFVLKGNLIIGKNLRFTSNSAALTVGNHATAKIGLKDIGDKDRPERSIELDYSSSFPNLETSSRTFFGKLKTKMLQQIAYWSYNSSNSYPYPKSLGLASNTLDNAVRTVNENGSLYVKEANIGYGYLCKSPIYGNTIFSLDGSHRFKRFWESWSNFEASCHHSIYSPFLTAVWEDKVKGLMSPFMKDASTAGVFFIQSSELFNLTLKKQSNEISTTFEIIPASGKSLFKTIISLKPSQTEAVFDWRTSCDSVLLHQPLIVNLSHICGAHNSDKTVGYKTDLFYRIPSVVGASNYIRIGSLKSFINGSSQIVTHSLIFKRGAEQSVGSHHLDVLQWSSISILLLGSNVSNHLLHYNFNAHSYKEHEAGTQNTTLHRVTGSFSITDGDKDVEPQVLQGKLTCHDFVDKKRTKSNNFEGYLRIGAVEGKECEKRNDEYLSTMNYENLKTISIEALQQFHNKNVQCDGYQFNDKTSVSAGKALFLRVQSENGKTLKQDLLNAEWDEDKECSAAYSSFREIESSNQTKHFDKVCSFVVRKVSEKRPCILIPKGVGCPRPSYFEALLTASKPKEITLVADTSLIGYNIFVL